MKSIVVTLAMRLLALTTIATALPSSELVKRTARTTPPTGCLTVGTGGTYSTINAAIATLSGIAAACIFIYPGTYTSTDQIYINYGGALNLYGYTADTGSYKSNVVTFARNINSPTAGSLDASATLNVVSANFKAYNINIKNTYGAGSQAVAVVANGDKQSFYGVGFYGYQDTLYTKSGKQYYSNCYMEGAVDYIFGAAAAWFGECTVASNGGGAITASSRSTEDGTWFVFDHSTITAASGLSLAGKVYLGRPWRALARVIFQNSVLTDVVNPLGYTTLYDGATPIFEEFANTGAGIDTSKRLYYTVATAAVSKDTLFGSDWKIWIDTSY